MPPRSLVRWLAAGAAGAAMAAAISSCGGQPPASHTYRPTLTYTRWVPDPKALAGPEPGYRPQFTGLTGADVAKAEAVTDASGNALVINITFTPRGKQLFAALTRANVEACSGDPNTSPDAQCAQRHLGIWLDLTQADIDSWDRPGFAAAVSRPFDLKCLARQGAQQVCPKLVTDPITLEEIDGGVAQISGAFTQQTADELAGALNSGSP